MTGDLTEQQQIEQLKDFWKKYGVSTLVFFVIAFMSGLGWHFWLKHREVKLERGSTHYEELLSAVINSDDAVAMKEADLLKNNYTHTPYAALAMLMIARNDVYQNNYEGAKNQLTWVMKHAYGDSLRQIARLRLARINIQQGNAQTALSLLEKVNDAAYMPMIEEVRGDSYLALHQRDKARAAYEQALSSVKNYAVLRPLLAMKADDLAAGAAPGVNQ